MSPEYLKSYKKNKSCFGGDLLTGNAKRARPFSPHQALHLVLRSTVAKGPHSMHRQRKRISALIRKQSERFGVKVYHLGNSGNHLHLLLKPPRERAMFIAFMRAISGLIARLMLKAQRGRAKGIKFWDKRPFSRVVQWGKPFQKCMHYISKNILETLGLNGIEDAEQEWPLSAAPS